jgi:hypothetical protein
MFETNDRKKIGLLNFFLLYVLVSFLLYPRWPYSYLFFIFFPLSWTSVLRKFRTSISQISEGIVSRDGTFYSCLSVCALVVFRIVFQAAKILNYRLCCIFLCTVPLNAAGHEEDPMQLISGSSPDEICMPGSVVMDMQTRIA